MKDAKVISNETIDELVLLVEKKSPDFFSNIQDISDVSKTVCVNGKYFIVNLKHLKQSILQRNLQQ